MFILYWMWTFKSMRIWNLNDIQTMALVFAWLQNQNQLQRIESKCQWNTYVPSIYVVSCF